MQKQQPVQQVSVAKKPEVAPQTKTPAVIDERLLRQISGAGPHGRW